MIDFLKIRVYEPSLIQELRKNKQLNYCENKEWLSQDKETIKCREVYHHKKILFCFYDDKLEILFKPHYYYNNNYHNANDFSPYECISVLKEFIMTFEITQLHQYKIINIEYGLNVISPIECKDLITFLCYHGRNEFKTDTQYPYSKKSYRITPRGTINKYKIVKTYNKGIQYPQYCDINTFRYEIKSRENKYIKQKNIFSLKDILDIEIYKILAEELIKEFKDILLIEDSPHNYQNLTSRQAKQLNQYKNPFYWYRLLQNKKDKNGFARNKQKYYQLLNYTGHNLHQTLLQLIRQKLEKLLNPKAEKKDNSIQKEKGQFHTKRKGTIPY